MFKSVRLLTALALSQSPNYLILISVFVSVPAAADGTDPRAEPERFGDFLSCSARSVFSRRAAWSHFTSFHLQPLTGEREDQAL